MFNAHCCTKTVVLISMLRCSILSFYDMCDYDVLCDMMAGA